MCRQTRSTSCARPSSQHSATTGNRSVRANARMKYLVQKIGIDAFRILVEGYFGEKVQPYKDLQEWKYKDWLGWYEQGDGNLFLGLFIENGRIKDEGDMRLKTAMQVEVLLREHGIKLADEFEPNLRLSMACPALPLCGLAVTEAERRMPDVVERMSTLFTAKGVKVPVTMRMTGCPNGCARPYMAELGFVGSAKDSYQLWLGGSPGQTRLGWPHLEKVADADLVSTIEPILAMYVLQRDSESEAFGDFCARIAVDRLSAPSTANISAIERNTEGAGMAHVGDDNTGHDYDDRDVDSSIAEGATRRRKSRP
eukprot:IDg9717t1